jgi:transcriptional activator of cad operon
VEAGEPKGPGRVEAPRTLHIGEWFIHPSTGQISRGGQTTRLDERSLRLLLCLAQRPGELVSIDELLEQVWSGVSVTPDSVYQAVASLRRVLGDDPKQPSYIATVPRLGYRMIATVVLSAFHPAARTSSGQAWSWVPFRWAAVAAAGLAVVTALLFAFRATVASNTPAPASASATQPQKSIAVLPFLDLTEGMKEEEFADGMTEELIDKLSKIPGLRVPAPTSVFYFKGKQIPVADIASNLGVVYVLDGSTRKSGSRVRIAARLMRAENGYVIWSETYDRPWSDTVMVQDDIAGEVSKALQASIEASPKAR